MTYKCFKCSQNFSTSGKLVKHMREAHSSFVEDAKVKIDRSQESSFEAKKSAEGYVAVAKCPFCMVDCISRRRLMQHLEVEHQDEDDREVEPQMKIIRVQNDSEKKLIGIIRKERNGDNIVPSTEKSSIVNNLLSELDKSEGKRKISLPGTSGPIHVSATSIKLSERRYKCFWCEASFRKRGKLMDHIDMFHKANKQQIENEAEMLVMASIPETETVSAQVLPKKISDPLPLPKSQQQKSGGRKRFSSKRSSRSRSTEKKSPEIPNNNICKFVCLGSITESQRVKSIQTKRKPVINASANSCVFFTSRDPNPLPPIIPCEFEVANETIEPSTPLIPQTPDVTNPVTDSSMGYTPNGVYYKHSINTKCTTMEPTNQHPSEYPHRPLPLYPQSYLKDQHYQHQTTNYFSHSHLSHQNYQQMQHESVEVPTPSQPYNYPLGQFTHDPDIPLDLTVTKYPQFTFNW